MTDHRVSPGCEIVPGSALCLVQPATRVSSDSQKIVIGVALRFLKARAPASERPRREGVQQRGRLRRPVSQHGSDHTASKAACLRSRKATFGSLFRCLNRDTGGFWDWPAPDSFLRQGRSGPIQRVGFISSADCAHRDLHASVALDRSPDDFLIVGDRHHPQ